MKCLTIREILDDCHQVVACVYLGSTYNRQCNSFYYYHYYTNATFFTA